jgi:hypothetical protein
MAGRLGLEKELKADSFVAGADEPNPKGASQIFLPIAKALNGCHMSFCT